MRLNMKKISFLAEDGVELDGILYDTKNNTKDIVISVHGMGSNCLKTREDIIATNINKIGIDYFCFNNRGSELAKYIYKQENDKKVKKIAGTTYEDVLEGYCDILGAISAMKQLGYENFYLQGHSLGCTKIVYTYNRLLEEGNDLHSIKGIILLSLIDIPRVLEIFLQGECEKYIKIAKNKTQKNELMPEESFIHPISANTFLRYAKFNENINFARYDKDEEFKILNKIECPLFMRWGNKKEMVVQPLDLMIKMLRKNINNKNADINYIDGANHSYTGKEQILADEITNFLKDII